MSPLEHLGSEGASSYLCSLCCAWQRAHEIKKEKKAEPLRVDRNHRNHGMTAELPQIKCMSSAGTAGIEWFKQFRDY